jgi:AcrR family transcriptional regulator
MPRGKPKARTSSKAHDLEAIARLDRVMAPKQARSTESMQRILQALEQLLEQKSFSDITMAEIEAKSGCGIATIYARFRDKDSILAALHESISERFRAGIDEATDRARWEGKSVEEASLKIARGIVAHYARNRNLLRAIMLLDDMEVYERAASLIRHASARIQTVVARKDKLDSKAYERQVDLGTKAAYALLQQRLVFHPIATGRFATDDREFAADLASLIRLCAGRE